MARIRTTKPEFWSSEQIMELSPLARLAFIGLWNFCDDSGVHPASPKTLKAEIFPSDDFTSDDVLGLVSEMVTQGLVAEFTSEGKRYWYVTGWKRHQRIDKPTFRHPHPPQCDHTPGVLGEASESTRRAIYEDSPRDHGDIGESSPPEGIGREGKLNTLPGKPDPALPKSKKPTFMAEANEVLTYLNHVVGSRFQPVAANMNLIIARLREGATVDSIKAVIDRQYVAWGTDEKMRLYLRPVTLFSATKFASYSGQVDPATIPDKPIITREEAEAQISEDRAKAREIYLRQQQEAA